MIKDLTEGKPGKILLRFTLPMLISIIFQQLYNIADSVIAGRFVGDTPLDGENAVAAIGASYAITCLFIQIANGINSGCAVVISQLFGAKKYGRMKTAVSTSIIATVVLAAVLTVTGLLSCEWIMTALDTPPECFDDSKIYLNVYIAGLIFLFMYNVCTGIFTALGDSKTPLIFLIASSVGNVILDLIMVILFDMGVAGVAWATFIAQGVSSVLAAVSLARRLKKIRSDERTEVFSFPMLKTISRIAIPSILQQSFVSVGNLMIQGLVNNMGAAVIAGYSSAIKLNTFCVNCMACMAGGLSSFSAQNIGAGKTERVKSGYKSTVLLIFICILPIILLYSFMPEFMIKIFLPEPTQEALDVGRMFLRAVSPFYPVLAVKLVSDGVLRGAGAMKSFMAATFSDLLLRVILAYILVPFLQFSGFCYAWPIGWGLSAAMSLAFYIGGKWKNTAFSKAVSSSVK